MIVSASVNSYYCLLYATGVRRPHFVAHVYAHAHVNIVALPITYLGTSFYYYFCIYLLIFQLKVTTYNSDQPVVAYSPKIQKYFRTCVVGLRVRVLYYFINSFEFLEFYFRCLAGTRLSTVYLFHYPIIEHRQN